MYQYHDLLIRKEQNAQVLWIAEQVLLDYCEGLNPDYLRVAGRARYKQSVIPCHRDKDFLPDTGKAWRWGKKDGRFYYAYPNIPNNAPKFYRSCLPDAAELLAAATTLAPATTSLADHVARCLTDGYKEYLHCYGDCTPVQQTNLAKAAAVLEGAVEYIRAHRVDISKNAFFKDYVAILEHRDVKYTQFNFRRFKEKVELVIQGNPITAVVKLPRAENSNAAQFNDDQIRSWIIQLRGMGQNYTNAFIIRKIAEECEKVNKPVPSERWLGGIMEEHKTRFLTAAERFGEKGRYAALYRGYLPLANALFAGDCWQVDGTRVNFVDHKGPTGKREFLYIIVVRDVHSGDILGYHFDLKEDRWAVFNALKMAVRDSGYMPYEIQFDRFPGHNTPEMVNFIADLEARGVKMTFTYKATGKARLERWFGTLQTVFMQDSQYYYGEGIKSRHTYAHRSMEYLKKIRSMAKADGWDFDAAASEAGTLVERYRRTAYNTYSRKYRLNDRSPLQMHEDSEKPHVLPLQPAQFAYLFGLKKDLPVRSLGLITTEISKVEFIYRTTDYHIISNYSRVLVCYDLEDLSHVHLYEISDKPLKKYLGVAQEETPALAYGPDAEWGKISKRQAIIRQMEDFRQQEYEYRKAVGSDIVSMLLPTHTPKHKVEAAESEVLLQEFGEPKTALSIAPADDAEMDVDVRNLY